ncbi:hypothetical protein ZIOFF_041104 [Zingiber officinale]|uniref:Uncharacterized protein n=1 Tax=Zingiber officinale TaxID=94328 RepID=A0A8J5G733_ZINOF|nr:hypothetical protein ZIOFF_041104 [Zingiber officinale]
MKTENMFGATKTIAKILMGSSVAPMPSTEEGKKRVQSAPLDGERPWNPGRRILAPHLCKKDGKPELCLKSSLEKPSIWMAVFWMFKLDRWEERVCRGKISVEKSLLRIEIMEFEFSSPYGVHSRSLMASIKVSVLILTYALIAVLLHPLVCQGRTTTTKAMTTIEGAATNDGKTIDQGIAYILMVTALLVTYLIH